MMRLHEFFTKHVVNRDLKSKVKHKEMFNNKLTWTPRFSTFLSEHPLQSPANKLRHEKVMGAKKEGEKRGKI